MKVMKVFTVWMYYLYRLMHVLFIIFISRVTDILDVGCERKSINAELLAVKTGRLELPFIEKDQWEK